MRDRLGAFLRDTCPAIVVELLLVILAAEEAIINSMVAAEDMVGHKGVSIKALPHADLQNIMRKYNRTQG